MKKYILTFLFCFYCFLSFASGFSNINFYTGKSELNNDSKYELDKIVEYLKNAPSSCLKIQGHTDFYECEDSLDAILLGWKRAYNSQQYLVKRGIDKCRLPIYSFGKNSPTVPNVIDGKENAANKAINRRVEFIPTYKKYRLYAAKKLSSVDSLLRFTIKFNEDYKFLENSQLIIFGTVDRKNMKKFDDYMTDLGRHLIVIKLSNEENYIFEDTFLLSELVKQNTHLGLDFAYFIEERKIDKTFGFYVCVLEWTCEE